MLGNLGLEKLLVLLAVGLVVLGPERLPKVAADAGRLVRALRRLAQEATGEFREEIGPHLGNFDASELELQRLRPLLERYLGATSGARAPVPVPAGDAEGAAGALGAGGAAVGAGGGVGAAVGSMGPMRPVGAVGAEGQPPPFDSEAT